jgi:hypothetical protein
MKRSSKIGNQDDKLKTDQIKKTDVDSQSYFNLRIN